MSINLANVRSASFLPGLQDVGTTQNNATISGVATSGGGTLYGATQLYFPDNNVMSNVRVTFPNAAGDLASYWFPVIGSAIFTDATANVDIYVFITTNASGRLVNFVIKNKSAANITFTNYQLNAYAHMYTFPWS